ncbi:MAG: hypothetical protein EXS08_12525 [Planctomycetes bacterium]|nr:hypothetical protein [Planctomycetota bacterium]
MCTASWLIHPEGFELFFNRDESVRRGSARAPETLELEGVRALAPRDADAGGTWLGVNEHGLALGLLNAWDARGLPAEPRSRGLLVRELLSARAGDEVLERLERVELERYRGFTLACFEPGRAPRVRAWDGRELTQPDVRAPLCSSSLERGRAQLERERVFVQLVGARVEREAFERFHASHAPERGPWSPCMHRADASTVSASQVRVDARAVALRYAGGPPCTTSFGPWLELARA